MVELGKLTAEALDLAFHGANFVKNRQALLEDGAALEAQALLGQIADAHAAGLFRRAVVERFLAGEDLHQRGFAGAVGAHQRGLFVFANQPVSFKKEYARPEAFPGIFQRKHPESIFADGEQ